MKILINIESPSTQNAPRAIIHIAKGAPARGELKFAAMRPLGWSLIICHGPSIFYMGRGKYNNCRPPADQSERFARSLGPV